MSSLACAHTKLECALHHLSKFRGVLCEQTASRSSYRFTRRTRYHMFVMSVDIHVFPEHALARLTLGPIIGAVTSQRAVVLIQTDRSAEVTLHLFAESVDSKAVILDSDAEGNQELASSKSVPIDKQLRFVTHTAGESGNSSSGHEEPSLFVTDDMVVKTCEKFHGKEYILSQTIKLKGGSPRAFVFGRLRPGKR